MGGGNGYLEPCAAGAEAALAGPDEPLTTSEEAISAAAIRQIVARFRRCGVSQEKPRVASQARMPVAAAPEVATAAMHCMHMRPR